MIFRVQCLNKNTYWGVIGLATEFNYKASKSTGAYAVEIEIPNDVIFSWDDEDWEEEYELFVKTLLENFSDIDTKASFLPPRDSILKSKNG